jgi:ketosteroid isomerase-like protein
LNNTELIKIFYEAFARGDAKAMGDCYAPGIIFTDPAFGELQAEDARKMWRMLIERSKGNIKISFSHVKADESVGSARWRAEYEFGATGRKVINEITAWFEFKDGKITRHTDHFDMWKWSRQALGWKGFLLGWTPFMKTQIQKQTAGLLKKYQR